MELHPRAARPHQRTHHQVLRSHPPGSWARPYLAERLQQDIAGHPVIRPGYAPDGWTNLVQHLRQQGVNDDEMLTAGVATRATTGTLIDRFRDRLVFPICHENQILGFVRRRNLSHEEDTKRGPKYLNTPDTPLFHKGDQLFIIPSGQKAQPVLVEGPLDAIAVTLAAGQTHFGAAPLGTSLTPRQTAQLRHYGNTVTVATDSDAAGTKAAERDFWLLASLGINPRSANLPEGSDPAGLVMQQRADRLAEALSNAQPLGARLLDEQSRSCQDPAEILRCARLIAAMPPEEWVDRAAQLADRNQLPVGLLKVALASTVQAWNADPVKAAEQSTLQPPNRTTSTPVGSQVPATGSARPAPDRHPRRNGGDRARAVGL